MLEVLFVIFRIILKGGYELKWGGEETPDPDEGGGGGW